MSNMNAFTEFANREVCNCIFREYSTQKTFWNCDSANTTALEVTGETTYAYGGWGHPKKVAFHGEKSGTFKIELQMQTMQLFSLLTGAGIEKTAKWLKREVITATDGKLTLSETPIAGSTDVYLATDDCGTKIECTVAADTKEVTGEFTADTQYVVYYLTELSTGVQKIALKSTTFPRAFSMYAETYSKTENDDIIAQKMIAYKLQPQNNFSLNWANTGDPATVTITCDLLADKEDNILDLITMEDED